ncbi:MAG: FAD-binding oxidoreductase [Deltaproteobacteria bacterium]|nr:FAD-binding oxidoreductase [Deltaproteobacteria bacterium]
MMERLREALGPRATDSLFEREFYDRDVAYVPDVVLRLLAKPLPDLVVRPANAEEVALVVRLAGAEGVPVTPRAGGSTAYGNVVPTRGGILLDLNGLSDIGPVDPETLTVWVGAGATWAELDLSLRRGGYTVRSYPSSARVASVGGWFSMGGLGLGTVRYGHLKDQVEAADVVLPSGEARRLTEESSPPLEWFAGAEGTLGILTGLCLRVRRVPEAEEHFLLEGPDVGAVAELAQAILGKLGAVVFNLHVNSGAYNGALSSLEPGRHGAGKPTLAADLEGSPAELEACRGTVRGLAKAHGATLRSPEVAQEEWDARLDTLRIKRVFPTVLGAELLLPLAALPAYVDRCEALGGTQKIEILTYGHLVDGGQILVMSLFASDERKTARYLLDTSLLKRIYDIGHGLGGAPYAIGLWNTPYLGRIFDRVALEERRRRKEALDPRGLLNPGKHYAAPLALHPLLFGVGMGSLSWLRRLTARRGAR